LKNIQKEIKTQENSSRKLGIKKHFGVIYRTNWMMFIKLMKKKFQGIWEEYKRFINSQLGKKIMHTNFKKSHFLYRRWRSDEEIL